MTVRILTHGADSLPDEQTGMPRRLTAAIYGRERAETMLRESLAREAALIELLARNAAMLRRKSGTNQPALGVVWPGAGVFDDE